MIDQFAYDLLPSDLGGGWIAKDTRPRTFSNNDLAEHIVKLYLEHGPER